MAKQKAKIEQQAASELAQAEQQHAKEKATAEATAKAERRQALEEAAKQKEAELAAKDAATEAEKQQALADAAKVHEDDLAKEKAAADQEKQAELDKHKALMDDIEDKLGRFTKAADAKDKIVEQLKTNFRDFDGDSVKIDKKTGKVKLHFQDSYFVRGEHKLSEDMKEFLRIIENDHNNRCAHFHNI